MTTKIDLTNISDTALTTLTGPKVTTIVYPGDDTATDTAGGQTINLTGNGFQSGCSVLVGSTAASVVSFISSTQISFTAPVQTAGTYVIYVINPDGGTAISIPGISYSGTPNWTTSAGSLGTAYETGAISATLTATGDAPITYTLVSGTLPTGSSLNSNGTLSGTAVATASATTYSFTIKATDAQNQDTNRAFSITINPDVVTWSTPADSTTYNVYTNSAIANVTMSATSAAGGSITYTADTLPTGLSITGANIAGTPTVVASTTTTLTATATSTRTATRTINWVVSVSNDTYFKNTTLLLNGETTVTPFISDASANSFGLTINGDTKPTLFSPYTPGYYSNYFDGTGDYLTLPNSASFAFGTGDFTIEFWLNTTDTGAGLIGQATSGGWAFNIYSNTLYWANAWNSNNLWNYSAATITNGAWHHLAFSRISSSMKFFIDGVLVATNADSTNYSATADNIQIGRDANPADLVGYISNLRIIKGTGLYTSAFTPSTTPLTTTSQGANSSQVSLLTCQSNRLIDNSTNAFTITKNGDTLVSPNIPFTANSSYSTYGSTYFDGTGDTLSIPSPTTGFSLGTGEFTIECWVYKLSALNTVLLDARSSAAGLPWAFVIDGSNFPYWYDNTTYTSTVAVTLNSWNHVAVVRTSGVLKIFVNGVQGYSASYGTNLDRTSGLIIGDTVHAAAPLLGYISDLRIVKGTAVYTTAFTPPTTPLTAIANTQLLTCQYNGGAKNQGIIDNSNFNNIITRAGNTSQGSFSPYSVTGWSNYFDGTGDYLSFTGNSNLVFGTGDWTVEFWVYMESLPAQTTILDLRGSASTIPVVFNIFSTSFGYYNGTAYTTTGITPTIGTWYHVAYCRSSTTTKIFVNGTSYGSFSDSVNYSYGSNGIYMGRGQDASVYALTGYISNLRIIKGTAVYTSAFTPSTTPLTAIANTSLLTCQSNRFIDNSPNSFTLTRTGDVSVQAYSPFGSISEATPLSYSNYFDGTGDYLTVPDNVVLQLGSGDFTVEFWINYNSITGYQSPFTKGYTAAGDILLQTGNGNGALVVYLSGSAVITESTGASIGTWYHYALVRSGTTVTLYRDGVSRGTATNSVNFNTTNQLAIGATGKAPGGGAIGDFAINGYMSNFRLVKGTAVYTSAFTPTTTPLTAISGTQLLTCQSTRMIDNSTNAFTITANGNTKPLKYNPFGYTAQSATSYTPSLHGGSAYFDGTGDYISAAANSIHNNFGTGDFGVEGWFYFNIITGTQLIFSHRNNNTSAAYVPFVIWTISGTITVYVSSNNSSWDVVNGSTAGTVTASQWYHIAYTRTGTTFRVFVNGVQTLTFTSSASFSCSLPFQVGMTGPGETNTGMTGYASDVRMTKGISPYSANFVPPAQALTNYSTTYPASLLLNFTNGGIIDQHGTNVLETVGNAQLSTAVKKYNVASLYFDGTGDYLTLPYNKNIDISTGDFTIESWVYATATTNSVDSVWGYGNYGGMLYHAGTTWSWEVGAPNGISNHFTLTGTASLNAWHHIACTRYGSTFNLWIDGVSASTNTTASNAGSPRQLYIGWNNSTSGSQVFTGYIDDFRITKGYARYTANFTAPTSALITK